MHDIFSCHKARAFLVALSVGHGGAVYAEDFIWQTVSVVPPDNNMPSGVSADLLGLKIGSGIDDIRTRINEIAAENVSNSAPANSGQSNDLYASMYGSADGSDLDGSSNANPIEETDMVFVLPVAAGQPLEVRFPQRIKFESGAYSKNSEVINTYFSAPSSGSQLLAVYRSLNYNDTSAEPKISEVVAGLRGKFGPQFNQAQDYGSSVTYQVNYDAGVAWSEPDKPIQSCGAEMTSDIGFDESALVDINKTGRCDIVLTVEFRRGISADHAATIIFRLSDNERGRESLTADFQYFRDYLNGQVQQAGAVPKL